MPQEQLDNRTSQDWQGLLKTQLNNYRKELDKFDRAIKRYEGADGDVKEQYLGAWYMVKGNKGMLEFVIKDLEGLLK